MATIFLAPASQIRGNSLPIGAAPRGDASAVAARVIKYNFPSCRHVSAAVRLSDGSIRAMCDGLQYRVFTVFNSESHNVSFGGGIDASSDTTITDSDFYGNAADFGGGVRITLSDTQPLIKNTTIARNWAGAGTYEPYQQEGGGLFVDTYSVGSASYGTLTLDHVYLSNNDNLTYHTVDNIATSVEFGSANFEVILIDTTVGDPTNSSCIGGLCGT
jgi:hypothetical protein